MQNEASPGQGQSQSPGQSVLSFIDSLLANSKTKPKPKAKTKAKPKPSAAPIPLVRPIDSSRWADESITLCVRHITCTCGEQYTSPCENIFIQRYHPIYGLHQTPVPLRQWSPLWLLLPRRMVTHEVAVAVCHKCFGNGDKLGRAIAQQAMDFQAHEAQEPCNA